MSYVVAIVGLLFLVFVHELGHFSAAKAVRMRALRFMVGFPPAIATKQIGETEYGLGAIPLGGYVKIPGMLRPEPDDLYPVEDVLERSERLTTDQATDIGTAVDVVKSDLTRGRWDAARDDLPGVSRALQAAGDALTEAERRRCERAVERIAEGLDPRSYWRSSRPRRLAAIGAGPAANVLACFVILTGVAIFGRPEEVIVPRVHAVFAKTPAAASGLRAGDQLLSVNGSSSSVNAIRSAIERSRGGLVRVTVRRDGRVVRLTPVHSTKQEGTYKLGFEFGVRITSRGHPVLAAPRLAWDDMWRLTTGTLGAIGDVVTPQGRSQLHSAVGIVSVSADEVHRGAGYYLTILAYVSLSLAIFNLLPFLPLDGGHIFLIGLEKLRGRMVSRVTFERISVFGIALMLVVFAIGLQNDLGSLIGSSSR
jgi:regulator of sigma E protease